MSESLSLHHILYMSDAEAEERYMVTGSETVTVTLNLPLGLINYLRDCTEYGKTTMAEEIKNMLTTAHFRWLTRNDTRYTELQDANE